MLLPRFVVAMVLVSAMVLGTGLASGQQNYPNKPIRIVAAEPGTSPDVAVRLLAPKLTDALGQPLIIDNRDTAIGPEIVAKAQPDGYTLLFIGTNFWIKPFLQKVSYDPVKDFSPITFVASAANVLVVNPSLPVKSVTELIALAKGKPGELNYAAGVLGSSAHLAGELFKTMAGVNIVNIPYKGAGPGLIDLIGGRVQMMFTSAASVAPHIKAGRLRILAVGSAGPSALAPGVPTVAASGLPGYEAGTLVGVFALVKTPPALIVRWNREILRFLNQADMKEKFLSSGLEIVGISPEQSAVTIRSDMAKWGKVIQDAGLRRE